MALAATVVMYRRRCRPDTQVKRTNPEIVYVEGAQLAQQDPQDAART